VLWGAPSSPFEGFAVITPLGNTIGAVIMFALGFIPIIIVASILDGLGLLRVPREVELLGLDYKGQSDYNQAVADVQQAEKAVA
jgi:hypothetical protein